MEGINIFILHIFSSCKCTGFRANLYTAPLPWCHWEISSRTCDTIWDVLKYVHEDIMKISFKHNSFNSQILVYVHDSRVLLQTIILQLQQNSVVIKNLLYTQSRKKHNVCHVQSEPRIRMYELASLCNFKSVIQLHVAFLVIIQESQLCRVNSSC